MFNLIEDWLEVACVMKTKRWLNGSRKGKVQDSQKNEKKHQMFIQDHFTSSPTLQIFLFTRQNMHEAYTTKQEPRIWLNCFWDVKIQKQVYDDDIM